MKKNLCFLLLMALMAGFHIAKAQCDADTAFFYLPQNEFNSGNTWYYSPADGEATEALEWIVIPRFRYGTTHLLTTIGSHNPTSQYSLEVHEGSGVTIDEANSF